MSTFTQTAGQVLLALLVVWVAGAFILRLAATSCFLCAAGLLALGDLVAAAGVATCGLACWIPARSSFACVTASGARPGPPGCFALRLSGRRVMAASARRPDHGRPPGTPRSLPALAHVADDSARRLRRPRCEATAG